MASGTLVGGGGGGDGSREKHRWSESKVYTRKAHHKAPKPKPTLNSHPPPSSHQTLASTADDVNSSLHKPSSPHHHRHHRSPPPVLSGFDDSAVASDDEASSLNHRDPAAMNNQNHTNHHYHHINGHRRSITISLASRSRHEVRDLRRKLIAELDKVRTLAKKLEAHELQLSSAAPATGYSHSQLSANTAITTAKRAPMNVEVASAVAPLRRQLSVNVAVGAENSMSEAMEKEKRTPKANQYYRNSDFVTGKEKFPPSESQGHKKSKANGSKKLAIGEVDYSTPLVDKSYEQAFKSCGALLAKLMKHKHGWVFNTPVDVKGLGLRDYYIVIKHPMDLGTVKSRLNKNWYKSPAEFAEDVRLTFRNAMTYNPKGQDVHYMAEQLSRAFEERWPAIEAEYSFLPYPPVAKKAPSLDMRTLERSESTTHPVDSKMKTANHTTHIGRPPALKKPKAKDPDKRDMTFEEKQKLSNNLQSLPSEKLDNIVQIIKKRNLSLNQHDDEIEVDIDSVDTETLWELDRFVTNYKKSLSKIKKKAELLARTQAERNERNVQDRMQERIPDPVVADVPKESKMAADEKTVASSSSIGGEKKGYNASRSSSSSSSSSDSGSSSSDSDSESSSACGSDAAHSPRT